MIEIDLIYNLTMRENVIIRYVHFSMFSMITPVFGPITSSLTADLYIMVHSFIWYHFENLLRPSTDTEKAISSQRCNIFMMCLQLIGT